MPGGSRNRQAGHSFERDLVKIFRSIGYVHVVTSRSESKSRDDQKIDLINKDEYKNGRLPYNVQAKNTKGHLAYGKIMAEIPRTPNVVNVIIHNQTEKVGDRFVTRDRFAILRLDDFLTIIQQRDERRHVGKVVAQKVKPGAGKGVLPKAKGNLKGGVQNVQSLPKARPDIPSS